jgi:hypothetical protein
VAARPNDLKIVYFRCGCLSSSYGWWTTGAAARRTSHLVLKQSGDLLNWRPRSRGSRTPIAELGEAGACVACRDIGSLRMCFGHGAVSDAAYSICRSSFLACRTIPRTRARSAIASPVWRLVGRFRKPRKAKKRLFRPGSFRAFGPDRLEPSRPAIGGIERPGSAFVNLLGSGLT